MILVTGSKGFIGRNLTNRLAPAHIGIDIDDCMSVFEDDFNWKDITEIYHLGAISDTTETDFDRLYKYNISYSIRLFEKAIEFKIPVKYASSASVYGNSGDEYLIEPLNLYALSKATVDFWVQQNIDRFSNIVGYRFYNVYGKKELKGNQSSPIYSFTKQAKTTGVIKIFDMSNEYCTAYRDFVWVQDCISCMFSHRVSGIYDVGSSMSRSFEYIADLVAKKYNAEIRMIPFPSYLRGKYQWDTHAQRHFPEHEFKRVEEFIQEL
jgi:ADP-L-glycero-D-manno-heptose 6-epimerase